MANKTAAPPTDDELVALLRALLDDAREELGDGGALDAEVCASRMLALWNEAVEEFGEDVVTERDLVDYLAGVAESGSGERADDAVTLLQGLAIVAGSEACAAASAELTALDDDDAVPGASDIDRPEFVEAWMVGDVYGDAQVLCGVWQYEGEDEHGIMLLVERTTGSVDEVLLVDDPAEARTSTLQADDPELMCPERTLNAREFGQLLAEVLDANSPEDDVDNEQLSDLRAMLLGRLQGLIEQEIARRTGTAAVRGIPWDPAGARSAISVLVPKRREVPRAERERVVEQFMSSRRAAAVNVEGVNADGMRRIVTTMVDYKCDDADGDPLRWGPHSLADFLLEWYPAERRDDVDEHAGVPAVARAFVLFAADARNLPDRAIGQLETTATDLEPRFHAALGAGNDE